MLIYLKYDGNGKGVYMMMMMVMVIAGGSPGVAHGHIITSYHTILYITGEERGGEGRGGRVTWCSTASWMTRVGVMYSQARAPRHLQRTLDWEGSIERSDLTGMYDWARSDLTGRVRSDLTGLFDWPNTSSIASCNTFLIFDWSWFELTVSDDDKDRLGWGNVPFVSWLLGCCGNVVTTVSWS